MHSRIIIKTIVDRNSQETKPPQLSFSPPLFLSLSLCFRGKEGRKGVGEKGCLHNKWYATALLIVAGSSRGATCLTRVRARCTWVGSRLDWVSAFHGRGREGVVQQRPFTLFDLLQPPSRERERERLPVKLLALSLLVLFRVHTRVNTPHGRLASSV